MKELDGIRAEIGHCPTGQAVVTGAGRLPARYVFHAVGPVYRGGSRGEQEQLRSCYTTCLDLARERDLGTISFPSISTGIYGYPVDKAAQVALTAVYNWLAVHPDTVRTVKLVQFSERDYEVYVGAAKAIPGMSQ